MKIETGKLYSSYINILSLVKKYEDNINNLQFCYNDISNYWKDGKSEIFFDKINVNKNKIQKNILDLNELLNIYKDIYIKYNDIGNNIEYNLSNENIIYNKIDKCISIINKLNQKYFSISNSSNFTVVSYDINDNLELLDTIKNDLLNLKDKISNMSFKLKNIEKEIKTRISKIKINYIKEDSMDDIR